MVRVRPSDRQLPRVENQLDYRPILGRSKAPDLRLVV